MVVTAYTINSKDDIIVCIYGNNIQVRLRNGIELYIHRDAAIELKKEILAIFDKLVEMQKDEIQYRTV